MVTLAILFSMPILFIAAFFSRRKANRNSASYILLILGVLGLIAASTFVVSVNFGWLSP
jgi:hypothetical protein